MTMSNNSRYIIIIMKRRLTTAISMAALASAAIVPLSPAMARQGEARSWASWMWPSLTASKADPVQLPAPAAPSAANWWQQGVAALTGWLRPAQPSVQPTASLAARAAASEDIPPFYQTPPSFPANNGDLVRTEPSEFFLSPAKLTKIDADTHRILYRSSDRTGKPVAVSGTVVVPRAPWTGEGERPLVAFNVGTQGLGDQCAPSRLLASGQEYEGLFIKGLVDKGWAVVVTDYQGLGTEGLHTYMNREAQARAVLDGVRAAQRLPQARLTATTPVGLMGYSQGGGATAAAAELQPSYAPEINLKGASAGAVPSDLLQVAEKIDGSLFSGLSVYALLGNGAAYNVDYRSLLNDTGLEVFEAMKNQCVIQTVPKYALMRSKNLTKDGSTIPEILRRPEFGPIVVEQLIGWNRKPNVPVIVSHSVFDDAIPYAQGRQMVERWCNQGAKVHFSPGILAGHAASIIESYPKALVFLENRFANKPFELNSCANPIQDPATAN